jgi:hypothetical protein
MNAAVEDAHALAADSASDRPSIAMMKIGIIVLSICVPKFASDEADSRNQTP